LEKIYILYAIKQAELITPLVLCGQQRERTDSHALPTHPRSSHTNLNDNSNVTRTLSISLKPMSTRLHYRVIYGMVWYAN